MKKIYQYRYYGSSEKNYPKGLTAEMLTNGEVFIHFGKGSITHLGLQASPGTTSFLNRSDNSIQIGKTGIYEIDVSGYGYITSIIFSDDTLANVNEDNGIIIDIVYEGGTIT